MEKVKTMTIGIAGGSASGKTTLCNRLAEKLKNNLRKRACSYCNELAAVYGDGYSPAVSNYRLLLDIIHFLREGTPIL